MEHSGGGALSPPPLVELLVVTMAELGINDEMVTYRNESQVNQRSKNVRR